MISTSSLLILLVLLACFMAASAQWGYGGMPYGGYGGYGMGGYGMGGYGMRRRMWGSPYGMGGYGGYGWGK
ncbi:Protein CBR-NLP-27 [Caenorhabditis briggsae]|uniref:Uncharacterized protein n=2 Tax=Caenorhabditis briggsae TaxID=6238 RepID=A0AAE8ZXU9_CAEBR|nr:Protein CBR-NLP-27 [Caenorhabditis briggsae]ULT87382.1 hypothetical protein L3Y34_006893 [Caenorhabditis briggsae]UMM33144.1 hypothetical protein L5515_006732 [Caenorhabditis briggsae]CAP22565.1 Protein CBR-NLP-27 [Caenorhabditis briggsae]